MKILFISAADQQYDGRTRALLQILRNCGDVTAISTTKGESEHTEDTHLIGQGEGRGYLRFVREAVRIGKQHRDAEVLFLDNRKATLPGLLLRRAFRGRTVIYDARELYLKEEVSGLSSKIGCFFEEKMIAKADTVICANEERRSIMEKRFRHRGEILVFENFRKLCYAEDVSLPQLEKEFQERFRTDAFRIISTAGCELERDVLSLIDASAKLSFPHQLILLGCKENEEKAVVERHLAEHGIEDVLLLPRVDQDRLKYCIAQCHLGIAIYHKKNSNNKYCSSGKVYEYLYEGVPIATTDNPPLKKLVETYGVGAAEEDIGKAIEDVYANYESIKEKVARFIDAEVVEAGQDAFRRKIKEIIGG